MTNQQIIFRIGGILVLFCLLTPFPHTLALPAYEYPSVRHVEINEQAINVDVSHLAVATQEPFEMVVSAQLQEYDETYSISGTVTDETGAPFEGIVIEARPVKGMVYVQDHYDNPVEGVQVFRGNEMVGTTSSNGFIEIPDLAVNDTLVARQLITEVASAKDHHDQGSTQNWSYRAYITSAPILSTGEVEILSVDDLNK